MNRRTQEFPFRMPLVHRFAFNYFSENMPSPSAFKPLADFEFPPPPSNMVDHKEQVAIRRGRIKSEESVDEEVDEEHVEIEEDTFRPIPKYDAKQFGRVGTKKAYVHICFWLLYLERSKFIFFCFHLIIKQDMSSRMSLKV